MGLEPNKFGRYKKSDVIQAGYHIFEIEKVMIVQYEDDSKTDKIGEIEEMIHLTATALKNQFGIDLTTEQRLKYCSGFQCKKAWRGCIPVFDISIIIEAKLRGEI